MNERMSAIPSRGINTLVYVSAMVCGVLAALVMLYAHPSTNSEWTRITLICLIPAFYALALHKLWARYNTAIFPPAALAGTTGGCVIFSASHSFFLALIFALAISGLISIGVYVGNAS